MSTAGKEFSRETLAGLSSILVDRLQAKYGLQAKVSDPVRETGNVDTWKLKVVTHPQQNSLPAQRIHIDICSIPSYDRQPMLLRNHYGIEMGTSGLIIQAQSREEILADKLVAFALRANRIKNRDLWDIGWLKQHNTSLPVHLIPKKIADHQQSIDAFLQLLANRTGQLSSRPEIQHAFIAEMRRFLPPQVISRTVEDDNFWNYLISVVKTETDRITQSLTGKQKNNPFNM